MLLNAYVMLNIKSKLSNIIYLSVILQLEESSLINIVENYNHRLALNDNFTIMSNCTYFYLIIFISWIIKAIVTKQS